LPSHRTARGGTLLEVLIGLVNASTILRLSREQASDNSARGSAG
jgi:hypothetical protein